MPPEGRAPCRRLRDEWNSSETTQLVMLKPCPPASSGAQETIGRILLTAGHPHGEPQLLITTSPLQQHQGHHTQLLRHLLSTQDSDTAPKPGPFPSWGNCTVTACPCTASRAFPSKEHPKYTKLSSLPAPPSSGSRAEAGPCQGRCPRQLTSVKRDWQGTAHCCNKKTYGQSGQAQSPLC